jgi:hypothetical protein
VDGEVLSGFPFRGSDSELSSVPPEAFGVVEEEPWYLNSPISVVSEYGRPRHQPAATKVRPRRQRRARAPVPTSTAPRPLSQQALQYRDSLVNLPELEFETDVGSGDGSRCSTLYPLDRDD